MPGGEPVSGGLRVGIDLLAVERVRESLAAHADRYLGRVYTEREIADCRTPGGIDPQRLAARFAAKEAAVKVLRPARNAAVPWRCIEVCRHDSGAVDLRLTGEAAALAGAAGLGPLALSITHEDGHAGAVVVACTSNPSEER
jgi:holo-[acyl-carrier protein] synthase